MEHLYQVLNGIISKAEMPLVLYLLSRYLPRAERYRPAMRRAVIVTAVEILLCTLVKVWIPLTGTAELLANGLFSSVIFFSFALLSSACYVKKYRIYQYIVVTGVMIWYMAIQSGYVLKELILFMDEVSLSVFAAPIEVLCQIVSFACFCTLYYHVYKRLFARIVEVYIDWAIIVITCVLYGAVVLYSTVISAFFDIGLTGYIFSVMIQIIFTTGLLFLQVYNIYRSKDFQDSQTLRSVQAEQLKQLRITRDTIDIVNVKYHDLKNALYAKGGTDFAETLEEISAFENVFQTGNELLDAVLTDKSIICGARNIDVEGGIDGTLLSFMRGEDLCVFFGNALDNAIEYLSSLPESGKKYIRINVKKASGFIMASVENYYEGEKQESSEWKTTKADTANHGFGIRSMKAITEKYDGTFSIRAEGTVFRLTALFLAA